MSTAEPLYNVGRTAGPSLLWVLHRKGHQASCYMMTSPARTDVYVMYDRDCLSEATFQSMDRAYIWAAEDRRTLVALGWRDELDRTPIANEYRTDVDGPRSDAVHKF